MGAVSSESLGHPCRCRFLHHRNLDSRGSGYVLRLVRDSAEDPPGPYLDTHTKPGPSLHETSSARPCRVRRQLSPRLLAPHHRPRFEIHNGGVSSKAKYEMRDGPLVSGVQALVANRLERPWSRARVVSVKEKARQTCQVGVGKTSANEPLMKRRNYKLMSKPRGLRFFGISVGETCLLPTRHPALRAGDKISSRFQDGRMV